MNKASRGVKNKLDFITSQSYICRHGCQWTFSKINLSHSINGYIYNGRTNTLKLLDHALAGVAQLVGVSSCTPKCCGFISPIGACMGGNRLMFFTSMLLLTSSSFPPFLSLNIPLGEDQKREKNRTIESEHSRTPCSLKWAANVGWTPGDTWVEVEGNECWPRLLGVAHVCTAPGPHYIPVSPGPCGLHCEGAPPMDRLPPISDFMVQLLPGQDQTLIRCLNLYQPKSGCMLAMFPTYHLYKITY